MYAETIATLSAACMSVGVGGLVHLVMMSAKAEEEDKRQPRTLPLKQSEWTKQEMAEHVQWMDQMTALKAEDRAWLRDVGKYDLSGIPSEPALGWEDRW